MAAIGPGQHPRATFRAAQATPRNEALSRHANTVVGSTRFDELLAFALDPDYLAAKVCLILDNIDWQSIEVQDMVMDELERIERRPEATLYTMLAARTVTLRRHDEKSGRNLMGNERRVHDARSQPQLLARVVSTRVNLLTEFAERVFEQSVSENGSLEESFNFLFEQSLLGEAAVDDIFELRARLLARLSRGIGTSHDDFVPVLIRWHNSSIRSASYHLSTLVDWVLTGNDPTLVSTEPIAGPDDISDEELRVRLERLMIWGEDAIPGSQPQTLDIVLPKSSRGNRPLLTPLHILEYLAAHRAPLVTWGELCSIGHAYGLSDRHVWEHLRSLTRGRGFEAEGLVSIELDHSRWGRSMDPETCIVLREAGEVFMTRVVIGSEFLAWAALYVDREHPPPRVEITRLEDVADADTRHGLAIDFLGTILGDAYRDERERFSRLDPNEEDIAGLADAREREWEGGFGLFRSGESQAESLLPLRSLNAMKGELGLSTILKQQHKLVTDLYSALCRQIEHG